MWLKTSSRGWDQPRLNKGAAMRLSPSIVRTILASLLAALIVAALASLLAGAPEK